MKILITGSTGFLGSHLTKELVKEGHEVIILKRSYSNIWRIADTLPKVTSYNIDKCSIKQPFIECRPIDVVIHTATRYDRNEEAASELLDANVLFPLKLLETASSYETKMFINTDSFINKMNGGYKHLAGYALTKKQFLEWGREFSLKEKIHFINVKLEHIYGSFDSKDKFTTFILNSCLNNIPELTLTPGNQMRDFIHIDDVVAAYSLIIKQKSEQKAWFKEYQLGTGEPKKIRDFVEMIHRKSQSKTVLKFGAIPYRENELMESKANIEELQKIGWRSKINLERGIELMVADERKILNNQSLKRD